MIKNYLIYGILFCISIAALVLAILAFNKTSGEHYKKEMIGTSFEDIPKDFKKKMHTYLDGLLSTIKTEGKYLSLNGRLAPKNIKTEHLKEPIGSKKHINALIELYYLLSLFHKFALSKNLLYSITSGNLLSYYSGGDILLWDDDIDVHVNTPSFKIMTDLWDNSGKSYKIWDENWTYKKIIMGSKNIILLRLRNDNFFKIKLNASIDSNQKDIGGLDIVLHWTPLTVPTNVKNIVFNTKDENEKKYPIINYGPVETRVLRKELAILLLDTMYSKKWPIKKHPSLF